MSVSVTSEEIRRYYPERKSELSPTAYSDQLMPALRLTRSSRTAGKIARWLFIALSITVVIMAFAPWQQSVTGSGNVIAYSPQERPQTLESPIKGRISRLGDNIYENAFVHQGQLIAEIQDLDEEYSRRLENQLYQSQQAVQAARAQLESAHAAVDAAHQVVESVLRQVAAYINVKAQTIAAQDAFVEMAERKVFSYKQQLLEYQAAIPQLEAELERVRTLRKEGNISLQKEQEVEAKLNAQNSKVAKAQADVEAAEKDLEGKMSERDAKIEKAQVDIDYAEALRRKAEQDLAKAQQEVGKATQEVSKAEKDLLEAEVKLARQSTQFITAPFDGYIVSITPNMGASMLKEGDPICTIVPATQDRAVQVWLKGNDAPLVEPGRHVRIQFEGWPALQFAGWPSVAVGTFGGEVVSVDATDDGKGKFRILVRPDPSDDPWPDERYLRQGVRANAWVLLNQVPMWFEFWRQLNGFPPVVSDEAPESKDSEKKSKPKLPK
jgi:multidrug resistance efflux pump